MQFYILMIDYGKGPQHPMGLEAICSPEHTRRQIVEEVRGILKRGKNSVAFVKFVDGNFIEDVTEDILEEAAQEDSPCFDRPNRADRAAFAFDHARALRQETV